MNPDSPKMPREEMETWLTSLLLGELSAGEAAAVRELIKHDPELAKLHDDLKSTIQLVREVTVKEATSTPPVQEQPKLSAERREKLLAQFKTVQLTEPNPGKRRFTLVELAAVVAIIGILAAIAMPSLSSLGTREYALTASAPETARLAADAALESAPASLPTIQLSMDGSVGTVSGRKAETSFSYDGGVDGSGGNLSFYSKFGQPEPARKPVGLTPAPVTPSTPIVLPDLPADSPNQPQNAGSFRYAAANPPLSSGSRELGRQLQEPATQPPTELPVVGTLAGSAGDRIETRAFDPSGRENLQRDSESLGDAFRRYYVPRGSVAGGGGGGGGGATPTPTLNNDSLSLSDTVGVKVEAIDEGKSISAGETVRTRGITQDDARGSDTASRPRTLPETPVADSYYLPLSQAQVVPSVTVTNYSNYATRESETLLNRPGVEVARVETKDGRTLLVPTVDASQPSRPPAQTPPEVRLYAQFSESEPSDNRAQTSRSELVVGRTFTDSTSDQRGDNSQHVAMTQPLMESESLERSKALIPEREGFYAEQRGRLEQLKSLDKSQLRQQLSDDSELGETSLGLKVAEDRLATLQKDSAVSATDVEQAQKQVTDLKEKADARANGVMRRLETQNEMLRSELETLKGAVATGKELEAGGRETPLLSTEDYKRFLGERSSGESKLRELYSELEALKDKNSLAAEELSKQIAETQERLRTSQEHVEKKRSADNARLAATRPYYDAKRNLEDMVDFQRLLVRKMNLEEIDLRLPGSAQVVIVDRAQAKDEPKQSLWGGIRNAMSGDVERVARIKVDRDKTDIEELNAAAAPRLNPYDPHFIQSQLEIIQSETILGRAAEQMGLSKDTDSSLKKSEAVAQLRKRLELQAVPNTTLVEIRATADKPEEAAKIANTVAEVYQQWRLDKGNELVRGSLKSLEERSREQEEKIRKARVELAQLAQSLGISDADASGRIATDLPIRKPSTNAPIPQPEIQTSENYFSTFSLNVSDVSFKLAAASLEKGQMPDSASVRSEEFINAFDYRDPEPAPGAPIAFAWERTRYPFAHNRDLLRFSLKTAAAGRQAGRPLNLVLLLDNSGSMERADRVRIIREALRVLAGQLQPQDKLSVITFARTPRLVADGIAGDRTTEVTEAVSGLTPEGGTNLEEAMNLGYQTAARHYVIGGINRVVVLTDGAANLGDVQPESLKQKVEDARKQGIALDCFGIGWEGFNDDLLEVLSRNGDGRYGFINSPEEAASEFAGQLAGALKVAASDVKVQVEFNPRRVTSYRQIGYAKHQLTKEQFRDNTVDAAEIAAQEAGNALYTVEVNPAGAGPLCTVHVRYKIPGTTDYREQAWDVPYTGNAPSLEQSSPAMRLAASAAAFSEWLVASPFAGDVSPDAVLNVLRGVPEAFGADSRPKTLEWMIRQAKSIEGK